MSSKEKAISLIGVSKSYQLANEPYRRLLDVFLSKNNKSPQGFFALKDINLDIYKGETIGVIGNNGAGKSTLLQLVCNTLEPSKGSIKVNGRVAALLELGAGFNLELTGRENVILYALIMGLDKQTIDKELENIVCFADIGDFFDKEVKTYSSGMVVRLAFSVIAHINADILIIDEALAVGDAIFTQKCMRFLREFQKKGTILLVSHDIATVSSFCSRILWLENGVCKLQGEAKVVAEKYLEDCYGSQQKTDCVSEARLHPASKKAQSNSDGLDIRQSMLRTSTLRNDLKVFRHTEHDKGFGSGGALVSSCYFVDESGQPLAWVMGGERVTLVIDCEILAAVDSPIVGFVIKDKLGQTLFGDNSFLSHQNSPVSCVSSDVLTAEFSFVMPVMPAGSFCVSATIASGSQEKHVLHHWLHDALVFESQANSLSTGLLGIPMSSISLVRKEQTNVAHS